MFFHRSTHANTGGSDGGGCAMDRFTDIQQIGEGTYGIVYKGYMKGSKGTCCCLGVFKCLGVGRVW